MPEDVAAIGYHDIALAAQIDRGLTTIAQPMRAPGETAARLRLQRRAAPAARLTAINLQ